MESLPPHFPQYDRSVLKLEVVLLLVLGATFAFAPATEKAKLKWVVLFASRIVWLLLSLMSKS